MRNYTNVFTIGNTVIPIARSSPSIIASAYGDSEHNAFAISVSGARAMYWVANVRTVEVNR